MNTKRIDCQTIRYEEFPELLFGKEENADHGYFDATHFIRSRGDEKRHNVREFRMAFHYWIDGLCRQYGIDKDDLIIWSETNGHVLLDECLDLLFIVYIDPAFGAYMLERMSQMLSEGFAVSDSWLYKAAKERLFNTDTQGDDGL